VVEPEKFAAGMTRQLERLRQARAGGMPRRGWKIGINVPEMLRRLDLPHPGVAWIDGGKVLATGSELEVPPGARLHVEPELAIRLGEAVAPGTAADTAARRIDSVQPALEIVDYALPTSGLEDLVAHGMFHRATVLGLPADFATAAELGTRWPALRVGERTGDSPRSDLVPSDLGELVVFAADYLAAFGEALEPGDLILSGSYLARAAPWSAGDEVVADFGPLGAVSARAAAAPHEPA